MTAIKARAKSDEVRELAGHSSNQWKQFMKFTREEAERLLQDEPTATWIDIMDEEQDRVLEAVNLRLQGKGAPVVTAEILAWRMPKAMGQLRKGSGTNTREDEIQGES